MERRVLEKTDSKTSVLLFVGIVLAAYFGHGMALQLLGPTWASTMSSLALVVYLTFAYLLRDNWRRASLASVASVILALSLHYVLRR
jgi:hypothetical protein